MDISRQTVIPMLAYRDGLGALDWLANAFGFIEKARLVDGQGRLAHGEMLANGSLIMLATPTDAYEGPSLHRTHCATADKWLSVPWVIDGVLVYIEDAEAHYETAKRAGAKILSDIEDGPPGKRYRAEDLEGHRWMFVEAQFS